jgi:cytochrome c oxidase subunit 2
MFPTQASTQAVSVDTLFAFMLGLALVFLLLVVIPLGYFALKYRRRSPDEMPPATVDSPKLEVLWTVAPLVLALGVFVWGASLFLNEARLPANAVEIFVLGKQWLWKFQHASGRQEISELHVPLGQPVRLTMTAQDVIHSFFVPAFRIKQDVLPGRYTTVWFQATQLGEFTAFCAEYCGTDHSAMLTQVTVMEPAAYQAWLAAGPVEAPAAQGAQFFQQLGCHACHHPDSSGQAPSLIGLYGRQVRLQSGEAVTADENYLRESILQPQAKIVEGYPPIMPSFAGQVSEEQLMQLILYIKSLAALSPGAAGPAPAPSPARSASP